MSANGTATAHDASFLSRTLLVLGGTLCALPWALIYPPVVRFQIEFGLGLGIALALAGLVHPGSGGKRLSRTLIQVCVVLLGLRMDLHEVVRAGASGMAFAVATIIATFVLGAGLGRLLRTDGKLTTLVSSGTAICGGSAIAAMSTVIGASSAQISVGTATIFILNGAALYLFPYLGHLLHLTPTQFGEWAGVAIHDVSSVVGAAQTFDVQSVDTATIVKLTRVLWIVPICVVAAWWARRQGGAAQPRGMKLPIPWFIAFFVVAAGVRTAWPAPLAAVAPGVLMVTKSGMATALFLIGAGLSRKALAEVGWRPLALGVMLWVFIAGASLAVVIRTVE